MQTVMQDTVLCKSIFQGTTAEEIAKGFNQKWIELINRLERLKGAAETRQK